MANNPLKSISRRLQSCYEEHEARAIARYILEVRFGMTLTDICAGKDKQFSAEERDDLENIIGRLQQNEPVQYVLQQADFCGRTFHVASGVLIPRPETEELVRWILDEHAGSGAPRILDIGTGSGCIAITLSLEIPQAEVTAIDISPAALGIAKKNAEAHHARVSFRTQDILQKDIPADSGGNIDIIVSNPPYICLSEEAEMGDNILRYEPRTALFVPDDTPLLFYEAIGDFARKALRPQGFLYVETNRRYGHETVELLRRIGLKDIELRKDLCGNDRMIRCRK